MCGIVAILSAQNQVSPELLRECTSRLTHRGPEVSRQWIARHHKVGLGHARLSIIDLTNGNQPLSSEDEQIHAVVNGEFYGFKAIRRDLEVLGHRFKTGSDSEILIHLYEQYGTECLQYLRGEFAFVLWDEANKCLFAARDRFGIKPLFYAWSKNTLILASEAKALFAAGVPAQWDYESLYQSLHFVMPQNRTLFQGIHQIPAGHFVLVTESTIQTRRYWDFNYPADDIAPTKTDPEYVEDVRSGIEEAVKLRLEADVPVACYLSGGLDSSAVVGIATKLSLSPITAFTLAFDHATYNEAPVARRTADSLGTTLTEIPISDSDLADNFGAAITQSETLAFNSNGVAKYLLSRAVQHAGFKVVLTGEGADEIFGGYPHFKRDNLLYSCGNGGQNAAEALNQLQHSNSVYKGLENHVRNPAFDSVRELLGFAPSQWECTSNISGTLRALLSDEYCSQFAAQDPYLNFMKEIDVSGQLARRHPVHQSMYLWSKTWLPNYILSFLGDRMEMAHSLEGRLPFLDHALVEKLCRMPVDQKIRGMTEKYILREAVRPYVTPEVYMREKHPFAAPPALSSNGAMQTLVQDTLRSKAFTSLPFDKVRALKLLDQYAAMEPKLQCEMDAVLMALTSASTLQQSLRL